MKDVTLAWFLMVKSPSEHHLSWWTLGLCMTLPLSPLWAASAGLGFVLRRLVVNQFDRLPSV